jgi:sugar O-acyltransferase (sialic acid O-acetyltransferase NeuD family)
MDKLIIIGASDAAKQIYSLITFHKMCEVVGFAVNKEFRTSDSFLGLPVYDLEHLNEEVEGDFGVFVAIQWSHLNADRRKVFEYCCSQGYKLVNIISPTAIVRSEITGRNCFIDDFVIIKNDVIIEDNVWIKANAIISDFTHIESHAYLGLHAIVAGGVTIGEQSFVGISAVVLEATKIGRKCIVSSGCIAKRNMPDFSRWVNDTDITIKLYSEEEVEEKLVPSKRVR